MLAVMALAAARTHMCLKLLRDGKIPLHSEELGTKKVGQNFFAFLPFLFLSCCVAPEGCSHRKHMTEWNN